MVACLLPETTTTFGSTLGGQGALFRDSTACSTWKQTHRNKACLVHTWLGSRGQRASLPSREKSSERKKKTANLKIACWNIHTMRYYKDSPQRRSAVVSRKLARLDIDIAALSEVRFLEQGCLTEDGTGYTLFWSGKNKDERRLFGVGFMIKTSIARKLQNLSIVHFHCLTSLRLAIQDNKLYAPTRQAET